MTEAEPVNDRSSRKWHDRVAMARAAQIN